ncbi:AAA family ATPase [Kingella negevensis]|uniref:AAA family ATPase n=1 Tax=Kingella negevensis TaxID=1522312 RepID=UPI00050A0EFB|nr:AAA family ATPase [Kingella negevensis]MDK4688027.1 AAA family ATPase [Kingella negevensis]WII90989.1 AAA family ATPase [Kingella negevensis]
MEFILLERGESIPSNAKNKVFLRIDKWNDYSFVTVFYLHFVDNLGTLHHIGNVKIGFKGQTTDTGTYIKIEKDFGGKKFLSLNDEYFSLGEDLEYYKGLNLLNEDVKKEILSSLNDLAYLNPKIDEVKDEKVFNYSLLRFVSLTSIYGQFARIIKRQAELTEFNFSFVIPKTENNSEIKLDFNVEPLSKPSTNIHAIIGRNGVGKTTILNGMVKAIMSKTESNNRFYLDYLGFCRREIDSTYFSNLISISWSAFDTFVPPKEQADPAQGTCYFYIGLKKQHGIQTATDIHEEFAEALSICLFRKKEQRLTKAIRNLESDTNFKFMELPEKLKINSNESNINIKEAAIKLIQNMSSGHAIVLLTITKLIAVLEEKTLILIDEPESHLHPPLLSAFVRALSELLYEVNGVAIIATHSPVVLQEIPKSCVWKIQRVGIATDTKRPKIETFGENVGVLTREVFGLEVIKSGFHKLLIESVNENKSYDEILDEYKHQLGIEAKGLLKILIAERDRKNAEIRSAEL